MPRLARRCQVSTTESGFSEIDTMPSSASQSREVGMVARALPADADVLAGGAAGRDRARDHRLHRRIALVEVAREQLQAGVAVEAERELGQVVRADRHAVEVLEELLGEDRVARHLAHHDHAQPVGAAGRARFSPRSASISTTASAWPSVRTNGTMISTLVRPMSLRTRLQRLAFHRERLAERLADVARRAAKAEHRVLFLGLVARAADQLAVLVALEVADSRTITGFGQNAAAIVAMPSASLST